MSEIKLLKEEGSSFKLMCANSPKSRIIRTTPIYAGMWSEIKSIRRSEPFTALFDVKRTGCYISVKASACHNSVADSEHIEALVLSPHGRDCIKLLSVEYDGLPEEFRRTSNLGDRWSVTPPICDPGYGSANENTACELSMKFGSLLRLDMVNRASGCAMHFNMLGPETDFALTTILWDQHAMAFKSSSKRISMASATATSTAVQ